MRQYRNFRDYHIEQLRDPEDARIFLSVIFEEYEEDGDTEAFLLALHDVGDAQGGLDKLAEYAKLNHQNINDVFSCKENLRFDTVEAILRALGFRLSIEPIKTEIKQNEQLEILK
jgi:DNA-binding phage protein